MKIHDIDLYCTRNAFGKCVVLMPSFSEAVILPKYKKTLLFKNRDMTIQDHRDEIFYDVDCFGIRGVDNVTGVTGGLAIGAIIVAIIK